MYDLSRFTLREMTHCGSALRKLGAGAASMEGAAERIVRYLHDSLRAPSGDAPACALVRLFVTVPYGGLPADLQAFARTLLGGEPGSPAMRCLTLLATAGERPEWNARQTSAGHKALPLASAEGIARSPMIAQLIRQFGLEVGALLAPDPGFVVDASQHTFNVFHVRYAQGSPHIPAQQEFVIPFGIESVLGFGGVLPSGDLFAIILFSKTPILRETAELFKTLALNAKVAILPFADGRVFA
jgi:hypothetical protein